MKKQYRVAILGNWADYMSYFLYGTLEGTILNGHIARPIPLFGQQSLNHVYEQILWFKPHLVICHMIFNRAPYNQSDVLKMMKKIRSHDIKVAYHAGDARLTPRYENNISQYVDFALCNHNLLEKYSSIWGIPCYYWPYAALNQKNIVDTVNIFKCKVAFAGSLEGNIHHNPRAQFIKELNPILSVTAFPTPESGNTRFQTAELSSSANCVLGFQMGLDIPGYLDVRPFQYMGAGALYFHDAHSNMDKFFIPNVHYIPFERNNANDFVQKYIYYVEQHPEQAIQIKTAGFTFVQQYHSTKERMAAVISILEGRGNYIYALNEKQEVIKVDNPWRN